jgi:low molecular weight protein-tyrosine phosphatase
VAGEEIRILVVCSANQCRSPLAAASLRAHAEVRDLPVVVSSVGTQALPGVPATDPTVQAGRKLGHDLTTHASTRADADAVAAADLVVAMERRHVQELVVLAPGTFGRTFTLRELVRRGDGAGARAAGESVSDWLARVAKGRRPTAMLGASRDDDIEDPTGSRAADHLSTAEEIDQLTTRLLELLFPR